MNSAPTQVLEPYEKEHLRFQRTNQMLHKSNARMYQLKNCGNQTLWVESALVAQCCIHHYYLQCQRQKDWYANLQISTSSPFLSYSTLSCLTCCSCSASIFNHFVWLVRPWIKRSECIFPLLWPNLCTSRKFQWRIILATKNPCFALVSSIIFTELLPMFGWTVVQTWCFVWKN